THCRDTVLSQTWILEERCRSWLLCRRGKRDSDGEANDGDVVGMALTLPLPPKQQQRTSIVAVRRREIRFTIFALATLGQFLLGLFASTIPVDPSLANEIRSSIPPNPDPGFIFYHNLITSS